MSRFVNPSTTARLDLGPCQCDGTPHSSDWVEYRTRLGYGDYIDIGAIAGADILAAKRRTIELALTDWNLTGPDGEVMPIGPESVGLLELETAEAIYVAIDEAVYASRQSLPNASGARSRTSSRASASRTRR